MTEDNTLASTLRQLRERHGLTPEALAAQADAHHTTVRNAESEKAVKIATIRKLYYDLCDDDSEWGALLTLWAIEKDGNQISPAVAGSALSSLKKIRNAEQRGFLTSMAETTEKLTPSDLRLLLACGKILNEGGGYFRRMLELAVDGPAAMRDADRPREDQST